MVVVLASKEEMNKMYKGFVPGNNNKITKLAVKVFEQWRVHRNETINDHGKQLGLQCQPIECEA